jgi:uncharacterized protein
MLIVISPAKNLDYDSPLPALKTSQPQLLEHAQTLIQSLRELAPHQVSELMHISDNLGQLNFDRYQAWRTPFTKRNARPAVLAFAGDVYQGMAAHAFNAEDFAFAQQHLRILSGLYGVLRPLDLMQPYRLEMGTRLANSRGQDLYAFWGGTVTEAINQQIKKIRASVLINLASQEYFHAIKTKDLSVPVIEPVFKDWKNGEYKIISFFAKKARGLMSAYIVKNRLTASDDLKQFNAAGYEYNQAMSSGNQWVFIRKQ